MSDCKTKLIINDSFKLVINNQLFYIASIF